MKTILKNNTAIIAFILAFVLDSQYGILEKLIPDPFWLNAARGFGALILAYFTREKLGFTAKGDGAVIPKKGF